MTPDDRRKQRHDLRGEATAIGWAVQSLLSEGVPEDQVELLQEIARSAARIEQLVDELLAD